MTHECPDCGSAVELNERTVRIRVGDCPQCHQSFSIVPHRAEGGAEGSGPAEEIVPLPTLGEVGETEDEPAAPRPGKGGSSEDEDEKEGAKADDETPVCGTCGSELTFRAADEVTIEVFCAQCEETTRFRAESAAPPPERAPRERIERPERSDRRERGPERSWSDAPRARGCRRCGGPIDFETLPDGGRVGVCRNCGNRFTLPPRRDGPDERGGGRYPQRRSYQSRGPPRGDSYERRGPPRERRERRYDGDNNGPRRFRDR
jgi:DNA-directed RNA polymerase subunit RPC12/RpoP